jgi:hypothetical protein
MEPPTFQRRGMLLSTTSTAHCQGTISTQSVDLPGGLRCQLQPVESWLGADAICFNDCTACCIEYSIILLGLLTDEFCTFRILNNTR